MEYLIAIVIVLALFFAYSYKQGLEWEKQYKIEIGKYYKLTPEQSSKQNNFNYHETIKRTESLMNENNISLRNRENQYLQEIFYKGASQKGSY